MNGTITIRTTVLEYGLHRAAYDDFVTALEAEGLRVRVEQPQEFRATPMEVGAALGVFVGMSVASGMTWDVVKAIARAASGTISRPLPGRRKQPVRRLPIIGPDGREVLAWVELPAEPPAE